MTLVIPSLELKSGYCTYCLPDSDDSVSDPYKLLKFWRHENAKSLHIYDWDSFHSDDNLININSILYLVKSVDIPLSLTANFSGEECRLYLENGVYRVNVGNLLENEPGFCKSLIKDYTTSRVVSSFDFDNKTPAESYERLARHIERAVSCNISRIMVKFGSNGEFDNKQVPDNLARLAGEFKIKFSLYGYVKNVSDLWLVRDYFSKGIDSVIIGENLYEYIFPCQNIWKLIKEM
jgi:phosphoribosylformimino-5-aminoimidazole carboxamide ribonucleotide (ProFAR) isomerase